MADALVQQCVSALTDVAQKRNVRGTEVVVEGNVKVKSQDCTKDGSDVKVTVPASGGSPGFTGTRAAAAWAEMHPMCEETCSGVTDQETLSFAT
jgi:hypothetical protein